MGRSEKIITTEYEHKSVFEIEEFEKKGIHSGYNKWGSVQTNREGYIQTSDYKRNLLSNIKKYDFKLNIQPSDLISNFLTPPNGTNLFSIFSQNKKLRKEFVSTLKEYGFDFVYLDETKEFVIQKNIDGDVTQFSYFGLADTFQRLFFHLAAIESNKDSILIFEEPESHSYPPYIWQLANRIALDTDNQYFIATHSPYMLETLMQELGNDNLNIWITYFENYETKIHSLSKNELQEMYDLGGDIFFNMDKFEKAAI